MSDSALGLKPGDVVQDTYEILELLGEGGMGATFRGRNVTTNHAVAIKVMTPEFARNKNAADLFKRESSLLRTVRNDAVISYETTLQDANGRLFLIMEYIEGKPLAHYIARGARLGSDDVLALGGRLAEGLAAIRKLNIVHRDIAPDNILVPHDDIVGAKLIDFGLASDTVGTEKSIIGDSFAGKFSYSAPEQLGLFGAKVSPATDIYSLGLVLMRVAGLPVPGEGQGMAAVEARREDVKIPDGAVSAELKSVLESMLKANPADRPDDLLAVFRSATSGGGGAAAPAAPAAAPTPAKASGGGLSPVLLGGIAAGIVAAAAIAWFVLSGPPLSGPSITQGDIAQQAVAADDPLREAVTLIEQGGTDNLNAAFGALMAIGADEARDERTRQRAYLMVAQMYDPETHDTSKSPFPSPNLSAARRMYQRAADLGSQDAQDALTRIGDGTE